MSSENLPAPGEMDAQTVEQVGDGTKRHDPMPCGTGSLSEAGEGGRTLDIHVGNVTLYH